MKFIQLIVSFLAITVANRRKNYISSILQPKNNFFQKTNEKLHDTMNKLLDTLSLDTNFTASSEIKLLLTMHNGLNNIAEKNCELYDEISNTVKVTTDNKVINKLFNLNVLINEILNGKQFKKQIIDKIFTEAGSKLNKINPDDVKHEEISEFLNDFLMRIGSMNIKHLDDESHSKIETSDEDYVDNTYKPKKNLKVWNSSLSENSAETRRAYDGNQTEVKRFPFMASIHVLGEFTCAGSIINANMVITAASCVQIAYNNSYYKKDPEAIVIRVGSKYASRRGKVLPALDVFFHPSYDPINLWNNLAIIRVQRKLRFSKKTEKIRRILVTDNPEILQHNATEVTTLGWGEKEESQNMQPFQKILVTTLEVYPIDKCKEIYTTRFVTDDHFCAGHLTKEGGACIRDIGGPGIINNFLAGVVSFSSPTCGAPNSPTVFTNLGYYSQWIEHIIGEEPLSRRSGRRVFSAQTAPTKAYSYVKHTFRLHYTNSTPKTSPTTTSTTALITASAEFKGVDNMDKRASGKTQSDGETDTNDESWSEESDNYEENSLGKYQSFEFAQEITLNKFHKKLVNKTKSNNAVDKGDLLIWNTKPREIDVRKSFRN